MVEFFHGKLSLFQGSQSVNLSRGFSVKTCTNYISMKKIDILNFITSFRKAPNDIKSFSEIKAHMNASDDAQLLAMLEEMKQMRTLREVEKNGEKAFQVAAK
jgi:hypothetical protein